MDARRWQRVGAIFDIVVDARPAERDALLERLCEHDTALRREVEAMLAADADAGSFESGAHSARAQAASEWLEAGIAPSVNGERIGPWRLLRELGRGGMGVVCLAERADGQFEQRAALKLIKRGVDSDAVNARFLRERQILARLLHPHIAHLIDGGIAADGRPWFAMEFVDGEPLLDWCAARRADLRLRLHLFGGVCAAVQFAHGQLIVHRDIKPSNMLVTAAGEAKLLDFGIAKLLDDSSAGGATVDAQQRPFTPAYAAPEQLRGEAVTTATDIYALGVVLYELLAGRRPLNVGQAPTPEEMLHAQSMQQPVAPSKAGGAVAPVPSSRLRGDLDTIVLKALQREPQRRYASVEALAADLRRYLAGRPISARRDRVGYRLRKFVGRHRLGVAATLLGVCALFAALGLALWQAREKTREAANSQQVTRFLTGLFEGADPALAHGNALSAQDLLDQGAQRLRADAQIEPDVRARLLQTVATTYTNLGLYDRALPLAQQALALRRKDPTRVDADVAESLDNLGRIYRLKADYAQAEPLLRSALVMRRRLLRDDDPAVIESLDDLAALDRAEGHFKDADALLAQAVQSARSRFGSGAAETARYLDDYAANLDDMGKRSDALALYRQALSVRERKLGTDAPELATSLLNLGRHLDESGNYADALPLLERALAIRVKIFGPRHPLVAFAQIGLASVYEDEDRLDEAEKLVQAALTISRDGLPPDHPEISEALNMLAMLRMLRRDFAGAVPLAREVLARFTKALGPDHPDTLAAKNNLAFALLHAGRPKDAEALLRDALARKRGDNGQGLDATDCENLASALIVQGKYAEAVDYARRAVVIQKQREGEISGNTAVALRTLALAEEAKGATADAERDLRAVLAIGEKLHATQHIDMYQWRLPLADFLVGAGRCADAMPLLDAVKDELRPRLPLRDPLPILQAHLLQGQCMGGMGGTALRMQARHELLKLQSVEVDVYPTSAKLLASKGR